MTKIDLEGGKYTVLHDNGLNFRALRHGEEWRSLVGDGLVMAMASRIEELEEKLAALDRPSYAEPIAWGVLDKNDKPIEVTLSKVCADSWPTYDKTRKVVPLIIGTVLDRSSEDAKDAARYRFLREQNADLNDNTLYVAVQVSADSEKTGGWIGSDLDRAVDEFMPTSDHPSNSGEKK